MMQIKKAFRNYEAAIRYQRKNGSLPIEVRRGGRAMFYQGRAINSNYCFNIKVTIFGN